MELYLGMVSRPALTNTYVIIIPKMLGLPNTLNTSNIYSNKVKDITMNNEQVALFKHLRDYTGIDTLLKKQGLWFFLTADSNGGMQP